MPQDRNTRLERLMLEAGVTFKGLARDIREIAAQHDERLGTDHTLVRRWVDEGIRPRGNTPRYVALALSARLSRRVTQADLGWPAAGESALDRALTYPELVDDATDALTEVWTADLGGRPEVLAVPPRSDAWSQVAFRSLLPLRAAARPAVGPRSVRLDDVAAIRATADHFSTLDDRFGGAFGRTALIAFLATDVAPLLTASSTDAVRRELFTAASEATRLAAWMSYDSGLHGLAQRYFTSALRLAHEAGDRRLAGSVLSAMSHQATFLGRYADAADLARAALTTISADGTATLRAQFHAMEARALARIGDAAGCDLALADTMRHFERRSPDDDPEWIRYFDEAELAAELGHCFRDLGRGAEAITQLEAQPADPSEPVRSDIFVTMVRAESYAAVGELERACATATEALEIGRGVRSERPKAYLREFRSRLVPHRQNPHVRAFAQSVADDPLWKASRSLSTPPAA